MFERIYDYLKRPEVLQSITLAGLFAVLVLMPDVAFAQTGADDKLPYEDGLGKFQKSLQGPVPFAISLVGIVACGAMLIFGGEISGFMRTMIFIVLVVAVIVQASSVVTLLGGRNSLVADVEGPRTTLARHLS